MTFFLAVMVIVLCLVIYRQRIDLRRERLGRRREADMVDRLHKTMQEMGEAGVSDTEQALADALTVSVAYAQTRLGCCRSKVFELLRHGRLARVHGEGRATRITKDSVAAEERRMLGKKPSAPSAPATPRRGRNNNLTWADIRPGR